jgi:CRP-like cAMP-binding protein
MPAIYRQQASLAERVSALGRAQMLSNLARQCALLKNLPIDVFASLALDRRQFAAGVTIFAEGEPADRVHLIVDGHAVVYRYQEGKPTLIVYRPGHCVTVALEIGGKTIHRSYSISSSPSRPHLLDLTVGSRRQPGLRLHRCFYGPKATVTHSNS